MFQERYSMSPLATIVILLLISIDLSHTGKGTKVKFDTAVNSCVHDYGLESNRIVCQKYLSQFETNQIFC